MANASPTLSEIQARYTFAIANGTVRNPFKTLYGPAGSGKSVVIKAVYDLLAERLCVFAPTNCAAANLVALGIPRVYQVAFLMPNSTTDMSNHFVTRNITHVIVDEASMITRHQKMIIDDICAKAGIHLTYIGDPYQLPPVTSKFPIFEQVWFGEDAPCGKLDVVYRQENGVVPRLVRDTSYATDAVHICMTNEKRHELNVQCHEAFCAEKGVEAYADKAKTILNPQPGQYLLANWTSKPYIDRKSGLTKVTYQNNGLYKISSVKRTRFHFEILFEGENARPMTISKKEFSVDVMKKRKKQDRTFDFSYAVTCHSAQGKGFDNIYVHLECAMIDKGEVNQWDYAIPNIAIENWLYTALTRGKKSITVVDPTGAIVREGLSLSINPEERAEQVAKFVQEATKTVPDFKIVATEQEPEQAAPVVAEEAPVAEAAPAPEHVADEPAELDDDAYWAMFYSSDTPKPVEPSADELRAKLEQQERDEAEYNQFFKVDYFAQRRAMLAARELQAA